MAQLELVQPEPPLESAARADHAAIALLVREGAKVLDLGCGDGALMSLLTHERGAIARGIEIDRAKAHSCVRRGLAVVQGDAEHDLEEFPSGAFDYVVLSRTLESLRRPRSTLKQAARIGERVIVSVANAGHWRARLRLLTKGRLAPADEAASAVFTVRDFAEYARGMRLGIERATPLSGGHAGAPFAKQFWRANWFAEEAVFLLAP